MLASALTARAAAATGTAMAVGLLAALFGSPSFAQGSVQRPAERLKPATSRDAMRPCPEYGPKFFRPPGSTVCIKIEGRVRGEFGTRLNRSGLEPSETGRVTAGARLEARTETGFGPLRAVIDTGNRRGFGEALR